MKIEISTVMSKQTLITRTTLMMLLCLLTISVNAAVNIEGTRVVINGDQDQKSFLLVNEGEEDAIVQLWIDHGDMSAPPSLIKTPIFLQPPIFRLKPGELRSVRAIVDRSQLAGQSNEQLYWLNIYQVAQQIYNENDTPKDQLVFPLRIRVKLMLRPEGVGKLEKPTGEKLLFSLSDSNQDSASPQKRDLLISNPTQWNITLSSLVVNGQNIGISTYIAPGKKVVIANVADSLKEVSYTIINDLGNGWQYQQVINK